MSRKGILSGILLLVQCMVVFGQNTWKLQKDKHDIKIYTSSIAGSEIKAVKVECEINAKPSQLVALLLDVNAAAEWVYETKSAKLIKQVSPSELYYYSEVKLPWPLQNRDFVAHLTVTQNPVSKQVTVDGPAATGMVALKQGIVRVNNSKGRWLITALGTDRVKVVYTLHVDPGGDLPAWLINLFAAEGPMQIFEKLKIQVQKPKYKNAELSFIEN
ncbi:START domain-containing protein [Pedobacter sp. MC2016-14]|uniref:START domain-containing protein n=1 Tax=Pedobacter sp. MC2016-14 TaxID=2897327 RepID=UPI001E5F6BD3|nr:START domain-containing protein [Pedobacter sp. MC2016-14]MCD0487675.1 START domain-containing protein [Pedobacter sp. MC2016-14]